MGEVIMGEPYPMLEVRRSSHLQRPIVHKTATPKRTRKIMHLFGCWVEAVLVRSLRLAYLPF